MDVSAVRLADAADAAPRRIDATPSTGATTEKTPQRSRSDDDDWRAHSTLKFTLTAADVDAKFEIHEPTSRVTVTMYDRATGEVLREFPSREVLDAIASLAGSGTQVDVTS